MRVLKSIIAEIKPFIPIESIPHEGLSKFFQEFLLDDEKIKYICEIRKSTPRFCSILIACTSKRFIFIQPDSVKVSSYHLDMLDLEKITRVTFNTWSDDLYIRCGHPECLLSFHGCGRQDALNLIKSIYTAKGELTRATKSATPQNTAPSADDIVSQLERLAALLEKGILTQEEFAAQKKKLLGM